ncbi:MAG TPA: hypothetical protein VFN03_09490, partial [Trueperaceae bacterium]|nr:hypothetical protein [Trueperaceae bacterium]
MSTSTVSSSTTPKIHLGEAISLIGKTLPILWVRLASYLVLGAALGVYAAAVGGVAWLLGRLWAPLGVIVFLIAIAGAFGVVRWAGRYWFHMLRAAHTAVLTEFIVTGKGPTEGQLAYGKAQVLARFKDTSILFAVDLLVGGVVKFVVRTFTRVASVLPIPGLDGLAKLLERVAVMSTTYVDEAVLSRAYAKREENVWAVAKDGVVLYAQAWKPILANAVVLALLSFVEFLGFLLILGLPAAAIAAAVPSLGLTLGIGVLIGAWMLKLAVSDAIALAATLLAYHRATAGLEPDPAWVAKLDAASDKFRELGRKA